jgi:hypothetical protein
MRTWLRIPIALVAGLAACSVNRGPVTGLSPVPSDSVVVYESEAAIPNQSFVVATFTHRSSRYSESDFERYRARVAALGSNAMVVQRTNGHVVFAGFRMTSLPKPGPASAGAVATGDGSSGSNGSGSVSPGGCSGSCPVHVRGYTRKDGTYVRPHTRSAPGTRSGGRRH